MKTPLEVKQLGETIKDSLPVEAIKVIGEVSQPKNFRGNLYLNLKDNYCNIKAIIWKSRYEDFKTEIKDGDKIVVEGKLDFYGGNGSISFIIDKLIKHGGEGELFKLYQKYKKEFEDKGYFLQDKKLPISKKIEDILLITSEQGAAIQDFIYAIDNNKSKLNYDIIDAPVQGIDCPRIIIQKLNKIDKKYDIIVITRGGGSFEDLFGFSKPELIESIFKFDQPVLSAIGHQVDNSLLDLVADISSPTPSLAAQYIVDINKKFVSNLESIRDIVKNDLLQIFYDVGNELSKCEERINIIIYSFDRILQNYSNELINQVNEYLLNLKELDYKLDTILSNESNKISIKSENKIINQNEFEQILLTNKSFTIKWDSKEFNISNYNFS